MNLSLPKPLKKYVDGRVSSGLYGSASEFVREAIREKMEREEAKATLAASLLKGLDSGKPIPFTKDYIKGKKRAMLDRLRRKGKPT